jgi:hypothetical protein
MKIVRFISSTSSRLPTHGAVRIRRGLGTSSCKRFPNFTGLFTLFDCVFCDSYRPLNIRITFQIMESKKRNGLRTNRQTEIAHDSPQHRLILAYSRGSHYDLVLSQHDWQTLGICQVIVVDVANDLLKSKNETQLEVSAQWINYSYDKWVGLSAGTCCLAVKIVVNGYGIQFCSRRSKAVRFRACGEI